MVRGQEELMKRLKAAYGCPVELSLEFVGGKWKTVILAWLKESPLRYGDLRARIPGLSDKVLTERLQELLKLGLVENSSARDSAYRLTKRGESLRPVLDTLYDWGEVMARELSIKVHPDG
jgi:DNA-binding HxlR family transcriptional regulator